MAYADKLTSIRRVAVIEKEGGAIIAEGCVIEGMVLMSKHEFPIGQQALCFDNDRLDQWARSVDGLVVFLDKEDKTWEPRVHLEKFSGYAQDSADDYIKT